MAAADLRDVGPAAARPTVSIIVPWRTDGGDRARAWNWLREHWWALTGWEVVAGTPPDERWVKALAVEDALSRASGDVLVVADADVWSDHVGQAVDAVLAGHGWAVPHRAVHRLSRHGTRAVLRGGPFAGQPLEQRSYPGMLGGGCVVLTRHAYEVCPLDKRFVGWGQEDQSWGIALKAIFGPPWRPEDGQAPLWHLWHPPQARVSRSTGSMAGRRLALEYTAAADGKRMNEFLAGIGQGGEEFRPGMYVYKCVETGQVVESATPMNRLERLSNWTTHHTFPVQAAAPAVEVVADAAPVTDRDLIEPPKLYAGKLEWLAYARMRGVSGCDGMTKTQLRKACEF